MRTIERDIVGAFIFSSDDYLLLGKSRKGGVYQDTWIIPGGGIEEGETKLEAACRETIEEVGIDITNWPMEYIEANITGESEKTLRDTGERILVKMRFYNYVVRSPKHHTDIEIICEDDIAEASWHHKNTLASVKLTEAEVISLKQLGYL